MLRGKHISVAYLLPLLLIGSLVFQFAFLSPSVSAAPARCLIYNTGSNVGSSDDDTYSQVECESSLIADYGRFEDDRYYKVDITPVSEPKISDLSEQEYDSLVNNLTGSLTRCTGDVATQSSCKCDDETLNASNCGIIAYLVMFINALSAIVGVVIVIMITIGGIQYAAAGPNPAAVVAARKRIINAVLALALFIFMFAFLQWLVPGGMF